MRPFFRACGAKLSRGGTGHAVTLGNGKQNLKVCVMPSMTRRALVLTQESAGHWFRRSLPPHVFEVRVGDDADVEGNALAARKWRLSGGDWRGFLSAYCASFVAISIFIA